MRRVDNAARRVFQERWLRRRANSSSSPRLKPACGRRAFLSRGRHRGRCSTWVVSGWDSWRRSPCGRRHVAEAIAAWARDPRCDGRGPRRRRLGRSPPPGGRSRCPVSRPPARAVILTGPPADRSRGGSWADLEFEYHGSIRYHFPSCKPPLVPTLLGRTRFPPGSRIPSGYAARIHLFLCPTGGDASPGRVADARPSVGHGRRDAPRQGVLAGATAFPQWVAQHHVASPICFARKKHLSVLTALRNAMDFYVSRWRFREYRAERARHTWSTARRS